MKIIDVLTAPWAIEPKKLQEIRAIYATHMRGEKIDLKAISPSRQSLEYSVRDGVAVIPVEGVLTKNHSFFSILFGGSSMREIGAAFDAAMEDSDVKAVVLSIDSPGGTVDGTQELVGRIAAARGKKPIFAHADGMVASGAYWVASAADRVFISGDTVSVGSIGVVATHVDYSEQEKADGEKWTEITAGKYKRIASVHAPLSEEGRSYIQEQVDHIYSVFVESVASLRGRDVEQVLEGADGKIFIGRKALDVGLVDGVSTLAAVIEQIQEEIQMTKDELMAKHPELAQSLIEEGRLAGIEEGRESGRTEGLEDAVTAARASERERIKAIYDLSTPGNEKIIEEAMFDGVTDAGAVAVKIVQADKKRREEMAAALADGGSAPVPDAPAPDPKPKVTYEAAVDRLVEDGMSRGKAMAEVARKHPDLHADYLRRINEKK